MNTERRIILVPTRFVAVCRLLGQQDGTSSLVAAVERNLPATFPISDQASSDYPPSAHFFRLFRAGKLELALDSGVPSRRIVISWVDGCCLDCRAAIDMILQVQYSSTMANDSVVVNITAL